MLRAFLSPAGKSHGLFFLLLAGVVLAVFWPVRSFAFVRWDDDINITQNPLLTGPWSWSLIKELFSADRALRFEPLTWLLYRGVHRGFGFNPSAWHTFNLLLHLLATGLFYRVLVQGLPLAVPSAPELRVRCAAWIGAAVWALHPLRAEPVAWATAATYLITTVCLLTSFIFYLKAYEQPTVRRWLIWSRVFAVAGYASYPAGIAYGLWLMAADRWLLPEKAGRTAAWTPGLNRAWCLKQAAFLGPAVLAVGVTLWSRFTAPGIFGAAPAIDSVDFLSRLRMALASLFYLAARFFRPVNLTPNVTPFRPGDTLAAGVVVAFALLALVILALAWSVRRRHRLITFVCFGFAAVALPCLGWTERPTWPVDRYSYLLHLVLVGAGVGGWLRWAGDQRARLFSGTAFGALLVAGSLFLTRQQTMIWRDTTTLFTHMEQQPGFANNPRQQGHIYLLWALFEGTNGREERATALANQAQQIYLEAIRAAVAREDYREALALTTHLERYFPLTPVVRREKGVWLLRTHQPAEALRELRAAQVALPDDPRVKSLLEEAEKQAAENSVNSTGRSR